MSSPGAPMRRDSSVEREWDTHRWVKRERRGYDVDRDGDTHECLLLGHP